MDSRIRIDSLLKKELPPRIFKILQQSGMMAAETGFQLYLVGGMIRDLLLGQATEYDYDLVVVGDAGRFALMLQKRFGGRLTFYPRYLTATLKLDDDTKLDLVTARRECYSKPAASPRVEASDLKDDLFRRDFTVNALACSLLPAESGLVYDYYQGYEDLQNRLIRVFHPNSFRDDPLRIIRAVRFEQRYAFTIEKKTFACMEEAIKAETLALVSSERLAREVKNVYREPNPIRVLERLRDLGVVVDR
jgi:tRNA nucleotidyltransferase (CCA-adding enzyme)